MDERSRRTAYSRDGYIIDQARMQDVPYGCRMSDYNGCGWIAAFNFLRYMGAPVSQEELTRALSRRSLFRGLLGTSPLRLKRYLESRGFPMRACMLPGRAIARAEKAEAGVLLYRHRGGWHFVAFLRAHAADDGERRFRFLNAHPGWEAHVCSMLTFLEKDNMRPLILCLTYPKS